VSSDPIVVGEIPREPPGFQPRPDLLAELDGVDAGARAVRLLTGIAGAGKTQLAAAYARAKLAADWRLVAWVNAGTAGTLLAGLTAVADATGLTDNSGWRDEADAGQAVRRQLEAAGDRCLLVFDGAEDPGKLEPFVPADGAARVLITSTRPADASLRAVPVDVCTPEEARAFLTQRTGRDGDMEAGTVAAELGYLPLALAQAAAVASGGLGYQGYLELFRTTQDEADPAGDAKQSYPSSAVKTVLISLDAVRATDGTGVCTRLMEIMAVLSAAGVRREVLHAAGRAGVLALGGRRAESTVVDQALAELNTRSLLSSSLDGQTFVMHQLVTSVVRSGLARRGQLTAACRAAASVLDAHAQAVDASRDRPAVRDIPVQVTALLNHAAAPTAETDKTLDGALLRLRFLALYHLIELGDSAAQAIAVGEPLAVDLERALGPDHPDTLNARNSLAAAYQAAGRPADAIPLFEQTLVSQGRTLGPNDPDTLTTQNNLAASYQDAGLLAESVLLFELTLAGRERLLGTGDPSTLNSRGNLAAAYRATGRAAEAIPLLEQTLAGRELMLGADHPDTQAVRNNLDRARQEAAGLADTIRPTKQPAIDQPSVNQPPPEQPKATESPLEQPAAGQPAAEPIPAEQPPAEPPGADPPAAEELPADQPVVELPSVEQPATVGPGEPPVGLQPPVPEPDQGPRPDAMPEAPAAAEPDVTDEVPGESPAAPEPAPQLPRLEPLAGSGRRPDARPARRRMRVPALAAAILILIAAGGLTFALSRQHTGGGHSRHGAAPHNGQADAAQMAAEWVSQQVSHSAIVACDPLMCSALGARGIPAARLLVLRTGTPSPRGAALVVATPVVRRQFGSRLDREYAPTIIAGFGSGAGQVNVQVVAPDGVAVYLTALRQDAAARKAAGAELLTNKRIGATAQARTQLAAGQVDSRLLILLPALAATHPVQLLAFGDSGPEAGLGTPLCSADLSGSGKAAGIADTSYLSWLTSFVRAQLVPFAGSVVVVSRGNQSVVRVTFARPSPVGLLAHE
jgi:tetratricopeptide (TPR) repeat protein